MNMCFTVCVDIVWYVRAIHSVCNSHQVAYTASDSVFGIDKESYPRFYRMVPITAQLVDGYVALIKELGWNRVAMISHDDDFNIDVCYCTCVWSAY